MGLRTSLKIFYKDLISGTVSKLSTKPQVLRNKKVLKDESLAQCAANSLHTGDGAGGLSSSEQ